MNQKGEVVLAIALIIAGAVLLSGLLIAYKPVLDCSLYRADKQEKPAECVAMNQ